MPKLSAYVASDAGDARGGAAGAGGDRARRQAVQPSAKDPSAQWEAEIEQIREEAAKRLSRSSGRAFRWPDGSLRPTRPPPDPATVSNRRRFSTVVDEARRAGGDATYASLGHSLRSGIGVSLEAHLRYLTAAGLCVERSFEVQGEEEEQGGREPSPGAALASARRGASASASTAEAAAALERAGWIGHDPSYDAPPLSRADHPFNGHYRGVASHFLSASLGRLLNVPGEVNAAGAALQEVQGEA